MGSTPLHVEQMVQQSYLQTLYYVNFCLRKFLLGENAPLYTSSHFIYIMYVDV